MTVKRLTFESPYGCRWCGAQQRHHGRRYKLPIGMHSWEAPWPQIILRRMRQRRADRLNATPTLYHATTGWSPALDGESADPYCADCGREACPRWTRIQTRLDQKRLGLPRSVRRVRKTADAGAGWGASRGRSDQSPSRKGTNVTTYYEDDQVTLLLGDALDTLRTLPARSVDCIVTSPPYYGLRDYGTPGQYGLEETPAAYVETMRTLFAEARRVLADDGTLWLNLGDSYVAGPPGKRRSSGLQGRSQAVTTPEGLGDKTRCGLPVKNLIGIPWRTAFALQDDGWILRNAIIWRKPDAMPEPVRDRMSRRYEEIFLFSKSPKYWFDLDSIRTSEAPRTRQNGSSTYQDRKEAGTPDRHGVAGVSHAEPGTAFASHKKGPNPGDVWSISTARFPAAHFAVFPIQLPLRCIKAGCKPGGTVLDPFSGSGTTGAAARQLDRKYIGIDLNRARAVVAPIPAQARRSFLGWPSDRLPFTRKQRTTNPKENSTR